MKNRYNYNAIELILLTLVLSGCASGAIINSIRSEGIGILNPFGLIVGLGIVWYCWIEAKRKNRNIWTWLILGFIFGFFALLVLVYLKDLPATSQTLHNNANEADVKKPGGLP
jgi:RsiW-degrading membrane proteinase PrsW (M82 family)